MLVTSSQSLCVECPASNCITVMRDWVFDTTFFFTFIFLLHCKCHTRFAASAKYLWLVFHHVKVEISMTGYTFWVTLRLTNTISTSSVEFHIDHDLTRNTHSGTTSSFDRVGRTHNTGQWDLLESKRHPKHVFFIIGTSTGGTGRHVMQYGRRHFRLKTSLLVLACVWICSGKHARALRLHQYHFQQMTMSN
jgi:hypothetical protein